MVNSESRSWIRYRLPFSMPSAVSVRFLPIWLIHKPRRRRRDPGHLELTRGQLDKEKHEEPLQAVPSPHLDGEEIGSHDQFPMPAQKLGTSGRTAESPRHGNGAL